MKKMGRPTDDPKTDRVNVRLSPKDREKLSYCVISTGKTAPEIIRMGIDSIYRQLKNEEDSS